MFIVFLGLPASIHTLNAVATGDKAADLVLENCSLVNVYTGEILPETQVAISKDRIAYVGKDASHTKGKKTVVINLEKKFITPGFADSHIHIDQFVSPAEFVKKSLLCGVTSLFADSVDIVSTCGFSGFKEFAIWFWRKNVFFFHFATNSNFLILIPLFTIFFLHIVHVSISVTFFVVFAGFANFGNFCPPYPFFRNACLLSPAAIPLRLPAL